MAPPSALRARVLAAAAAQPSPTRKDGRRRALVLTAISLAIALGGFEAAGGFGHSASRPIGITIALAAGWAVASLALSIVALRRPGRAMGAPPLVMLGAATLAPFLCFAWMHVWSGAYAEPSPKFGWRCIALTLLFAATPLASFLALRRGVEPRMPSALGAIAGAAAGAWAGVLVDLWCPLTDTAHVLAGHVVPLAVLVAGGALVGHRFLGVARKD
jgi:hypothetical protein